MSGSATPVARELSCTYADGSQVQGCIVMICNIIPVAPCPNVTITRDSQSNEQVNNLPPGMYTVTAVAEIEEDGKVTSLRTRDALELMIIFSPLEIIQTESTTQGNFIG